MSYKITKVTTTVSGVVYMEEWDLTQVPHDTLSGTGVTTHSGIDTHIADSTIHFPWEDVEDAITTLSGSVGITLQLEWKFSTTTASGDPGNGRFRFNNSTLASVTNIYLDDFTESGVDAGTIIGLLKSGDKVYIQQEDDSSRAALFTVTSSATDNTGWWSLPVSVDSSNTLMQNNKNCAFVFFTSTGLTSIEWGDIDGTLSDQTDLQGELDDLYTTIDTTSGTLQTEIDDHTGDSTIHFTEASISHDNIADVSADDHHNQLHAITSTADHTAGNWKVLYTDGSGNVQELALGADGDSLVSNGPAAAPYFTTISGAGGAGPTGPLAAVQARRTTSYTLTGSYVDITLDVTDVESDTAVLEHNDTNTDRIDVKEDGTYLIIYGGTARTTSSSDTCRFEAQVQVNDSSAINGSYSTSATFEDTSIDGAFEDVQDYLSHSFLATLSAGDFVTLQFRYASSSDGANILANTTSFKVIKLEGTQGADGAQGPPGQGSTIHVYDDGTPVTGTPFSILNFDGVTISGSPTISGGVDITVDDSAAFQSEFQITTSSGVSTTTSETFQTKATLTTTDLSAGQYRLGVSYGWNHDATDSDFEARVQVGGSTLGEIHKQEPADAGGDWGSTGTTQRHYASRTFYLGLSGVNTITLQYRSDDDSDESSIWDAVIELWRVS